ncbi:MAG: SulP family inorganic anion transporter [Cytophagales bacterium]|tara:strand:- start:367 stop:2037 length:1671 start_codon:yes stop_codon:yes gene_type:complete
MAILKPLSWLQDYSTTKLKGDIFAGLTVGVLLIPQSMAYALIAGLPVIYGLYASLAPQIMYALFGSSRQLSVGPTAMDSLLIASGLGILAVIGSQEYIQLAIILTLMVGIIQTFLGFMRMGFITQLLSKPIISGFTSAAAILIGLNQLGPLLGIDMEKGNIIVLFISIVTNLANIDILTASIGLFSILLLYAFKKWAPKLPGTLIIVFTSIGMVHFLELHLSGLNVIGEIPMGLPRFNLPKIDLGQMTLLLPLALTLALISFIESFSVGKNLALQSKDHIVNANTELVALGSANFIGAFFMSFPVTGGFGRSAVNFSAGAQTPFSGVISACLIALTLLFFTDIFALLAYPVLAAIILVALRNLIDFKYPYELSRTHLLDFFMLSFTLIITLFFGMIWGISSGMGLYVLLLVYKSIFPKIQVKPFDEKGEALPVPTENSKTTKNHPLVILKIDTPIITINIESIEQQINQHMILSNPDSHVLLIDLSTVQYIDSSGIKGIKRLIMQLNEKNIRILWYSLHPPLNAIFTVKKMITGPMEKTLFKDSTAAIEFLRKEGN